jgi:tRNA threonylcarbamoyladenosine biosynthesis protein TsaE
VSAGAHTAARALTTASASETEAAAERLAQRLVAGDVLLLEGPLGSGKTTFVRGLARGLGVTAQVASPTFQLVRVYPGRLPLAHADLYRLDDPAPALADLGLEELVEQGVAVIEWGDRIAWPGAARVRIEEEGPDQRRLRLLEAPAAWTW